MLVDAEMQRKDGTWRKVRLWIDSGSPEFFISESLARDLGIDLSVTDDITFKGSRFEVQTPPGLKIGGMNINTDSIGTLVLFQPYWLFSTMHSDGNLPATVLKKYRIVFDYLNQQLTIADPGSIKPQGVASAISIHPQTGIIQMDAIIDGEPYSFALDMGASYSFISEGKLAKLSKAHPEWPNITGTLGCANMWGWWPANEQQFQVVRIPEIKWGNTQLDNLGIVGVPDFSSSGPTLGGWYSRKTAKPVDGFIGPNALKAFRVEIDYDNNTVYLEKGEKSDFEEMDLVGISVRQLPDSNYQVVGIVQENEKLSVSGIEPEDIIISIDDFMCKGKTMGSVVDKLRGKPGEKRKIVINRNDYELTINAKVSHFL